MATEIIIMAMVQKGGDRQDVHEVIRHHSMDASYQVKALGQENDLMERIRKDSFFAPIHSELSQLLDPSSFTGLASQQVHRFLKEELQPAVEQWMNISLETTELSV